MAYTSTRSEYGLPGHNDEYAFCHPHDCHLHCSGHDDDDDHHADEHAEEAPFVRLENQRIDLRGEYREPFAGVRKVRIRGGMTDYQHQEIEGGAAATTFKNRGYDARVEFEHAPIAGWRGVFGMQGGRSDFSALRSEEHTSELQSLMRISYAVFCLKKKNHQT